MPAMLDQILKAQTKASTTLEKIGQSDEDAVTTPSILLDHRVLGFWD